MGDENNRDALSVQLIKAHGGATTMLELSLPEHASEHVVVRRSNSRSAFKGFQNYLKNENKDTAVQMMSVDLTQQHHSFYEASSMMPPSDFAKFYGPIMPKMEMSLNDFQLMMEWASKFYKKKESRLLLSFQNHRMLKLLLLEVVKMDYLLS